MYCIVDCEVSVDGESYFSYGIKCGEITVNDLSTNREKVQQFVDSCNRLKLSPTHIFDAVEDFVIGDV